MSDTTRLGLQPANRWPIRLGGLPRCCISTIQEATEPVSDGATLHCTYTENPSHRMKLRDGAWEWNYV